MWSIAMKQIPYKMISYGIPFYEEIDKVEYYQISKAVLIKSV